MEDTALQNLYYRVIADQLPGDEEDFAFGLIDLLNDLYPDGPVSDAVLQTCALMLLGVIGEYDTGE